MIDRLSILGTGLLGASVGLALRKAGFQGRITGWNRSPGQARLAHEVGAIDEIASDPIEAARASQITLLSVPIFATLDFMEKLAPVLGPEHLVTDVGSTKRVISEAAARLYNTPERPAFLPGHPMAGKERGGAAHADADLFRGAVWLFTPWPIRPTFPEHRGNLSWRENARDEAAPGKHGSVTGRDFSCAEGTGYTSGALAPEGVSPAGEILMHDWRDLVTLMGAKTLDLDPARHDELVAWVSHLPQFTATALSALLEEEVGAAPELKDVGGRALREMTRLGASPFSMWRDIAHTNTEAVARALQALEQRLAYLRENLRTPALRDEFEQANRFRRQ
jgi:prephenate dehydrogenase